MNFKMLQSAHIDNVEFLEGKVYANKGIDPARIALWIDMSFAVEVESEVSKEANKAAVDGLKEVEAEKAAKEKRTEAAKKRAEKAKDARAGKAKGAK